MAVDLKSMSRKELKKLKDDVDKALIVAEQRERDDALKAAQKAAAEYGFSLEELSGNSGGGKKRKSAGKRPKAEAKYQNPDNSEQTWSGLGRKPLWIHQAQENGVDLADLAI